MAGRPRKNSATTNAADTIGKLQFKVVTDATKLLDKFTQLPSTIDEIKAQVEEIKNAFAYELQEKEVEINEQKKALDTSLVEYTSNIHMQKQKLDEQLDQHKQDFDRELEQLKYNHSLAKRDEDIVTMQTIADAHKNTVVDTEEWNTIYARAQDHTQELEEVKQSVKAETEKTVKSAKDAEIRNMKHSYEMKIAMAEKDIENLTKDVESLRRENDKLQTLVDRQSDNLVKVAEAATRPTNIVDSKSK